MKLYATITSERASKGQGGNNYLEVAVYVHDRETPVGYLMVDKATDDGEEFRISWKEQFYGEADTLLTVNETKGEKQKGEVNDNVRYCKNCKRSTSFILSDNLGDTNGVCANCGR